MTEPQERWECNICNRLFLNVEDAELCCKRLTQLWVCNKCGEIDINWSKINKCCTLKEGDEK